MLLLVLSTAGCGGSGGAGDEASVVSNSVVSSGVGTSKAVEAAVVAGSAGEAAVQVKPMAAAAVVAKPGATTGSAAMAPSVNLASKTGAPADIPEAAAGVPRYGTMAGADLGVGANLNGALAFRADNAWNTDVSAMPVDPRSDVLIASIGLERGLHPDFGAGLYDGAPIGIPYVVVDAAQARVPVTFTAYGSESDPGPYPIPPSAPVEGERQGAPGTGGDRHVIVIDRGNNRLYELYRAFPNGDGSWRAESGAVFRLDADDVRPTARPGWTSADAAGLPIFPGLVRYEEAARAALHRAIHASCLRRAGHALGVVFDQPRPAADGHAGQAQGELRDPVELQHRDARDPRGDEGLRHDPGGQRLELARERRAGSALEQQPAGQRAEAGERLGLRSGAHGRGGHAVVPRSAGDPSRVIGPRCRAGRIGRWPIRLHRPPARRHRPMPGSVRNGCSMRSNRSACAATAGCSR
jgi:hypothetical protein